ncbi:MAG: hypothetical protein HRT56_04860, partial [Coraliomargarita sp.]|nr:hypothetical protein [Coraliomargarita sp.]
MKIQAKEILKALFTFGYYGYVKAKKNFEENGLKKRIALSELLLAFMLIVPILAAFTIASELWLHAIEALKTNERYEMFLDSEEGIKRIPLVELPFILPESFFFFITVHAVLGVAYVQHSNITDSKIIW